MLPKPKMLMITTDADISIPLFRPTQVEPFTINYNTSEYNLKKVFNNNFDFVYFRDSFNDQDIQQEKAKKITDQVLEKYKTAYSVDGISSYDDMLFEDKWKQYQLFPQLMPSSTLFSSINRVDFAKQVIKKRISCRARGVIFSKENFPRKAKATDYIIQSKIDVEEEYRVYMVGGKIIEPLAVKSSKTDRQRVKIIGLKSKAAPELAKVCRAVYSATKFDLIGLDIAKTKNGYILLEANRSCQFKSYFRFSSINLADTLNSYLLGIDDLAKK